MKKLLLIGSLTNKHDKTKVGGVTILFELLLDELRKKSIQFGVVDTLVENNGGRLKTFFLSAYKIIRDMHKYEYISLQGTRNSFLFLGPLVVILNKLYDRKISVRLFAGDFAENYKKANIIEKLITRFVLRNMNTVFFELKSIVNEFKRYNPNTYWFPNVRSHDIQKDIQRRYHKRFVYIGTINEEKGIDDICAVANKIDKDIVFDMYGPIIEEKYAPDYFLQYGINYKGVLDPEKVEEAMAQYDVLVIPSYREGYPGVIIEAFALGMPVIATKLPGIMEMCENGKNAILIEAGNQNELLKAIHHFDTENYLSFHKNAQASFGNFDSQKQTEIFLERIGVINGTERVNYGL